MTTIARAVALAQTRRVLKHAVHDQMTHGNRDSSKFDEVKTSKSFATQMEWARHSFFGGGSMGGLGKTQTTTQWNAAVKKLADRAEVSFEEMEDALWDAGETAAFEDFGNYGRDGELREAPVDIETVRRAYKDGWRPKDKKGPDEWFEKHQGPGDHKGGTPQSTHGRGGRDASAGDIKEATEEQGGMTIRTMSGERPDSGFAVATQKNELKVPKARASETKIRGYIREHWDTLSKPGTFLGTWVNDETGQVVFDTVQVFDSAGSYTHAFEQALRIGKKGGEDAIYDLKNDIEISLDDEAAISAHREKIAA